MSDDRFAESSEASPSDVSLPHPQDPEAASLAPPAPTIDLGGEAVGRPEKPLGPRRLALLQEQMARHQRELAQAPPRDPAEVDPELARTQRRMAELASRAAISSLEDRQLAEDAIAQTQSMAPITDEAPAPHGPVPWQDDAETESDVAAEAAEADRDADAEALEAEADASETGAEEAPGAGDIEGEPVMAGGTEADVVDGGADAEEIPGAEDEAEATPASAAQEVVEPSAPVRAVDAQGLQLMEPEAYRSGTGWRPVVLGFVIVLVLAVVVLLMVLLL